MNLLDYFLSKDNIPSELRPVESSIKLAMKPWGYFVTDCGYTGSLIKTPMVNIVSKEYIPDMANALRVANIIIRTSQRESATELFSNNEFMNLRLTDNGLFFHQSAVNMLGSVLYYFVHKVPTDGYGKKRYADLPHVLGFLQLEPQTILEVLETCDAVTFTMLPYIVCCRERVYDQIAGMLSTLYTHIAPLATPENFWLFSYENTQGRREFDAPNNWNVQSVLHSNLITTLQEVRDYVDYLRGLKKKPIEETNQPLDLEKILREISIVNENTEEVNRDSTEEIIDNEKYSKLLVKRYGSILDIETEDL